MSAQDASAASAAPARCRAAAGEDQRPKRTPSPTPYRDIHRSAAMSPDSAAVLPAAEAVKTRLQLARASRGIISQAAGTNSGPERALLIACLPSALLVTSANPGSLLIAESFFQLGSA